MNMRSLTRRVFYTLIQPIEVTRSIEDYDPTLYTFTLRAIDKYLRPTLLPPNIWQRAISRKYALLTQVVMCLDCFCFFTLQYFKQNLYAFYTEISLSRQSFWVMFASLS